MKQLIDLPTIWRVLREADLNALRNSATQTFHLLIAAEHQADAATLGGLLSPDGNVALHPWIDLATTPTAADIKALSPLHGAILISPTPELSPALTTTRDALAAQKVPLLVVIVATPTKAAQIPRRNETKRVVVSNLDQTALPQIATALLNATHPDLHLALGRQLPALRPLLFQNLIDATARANASYALTSGIAEIIPALNIPLTVGDTIILTKNQLIMSYKIALIAGKEGEPREVIGEILSVLGGGFLLRQAARQLVGLIPVAGIAPKIAIAYAGTWAIGRAIVLWATEGQNVTPDTLRGFYQEALSRGRAVAETLVNQVRGREGQPSLWGRIRNRLPFSGRTPELPAPSTEPTSPETPAPPVPAAPPPKQGWGAWLRSFWPFGKKDPEQSER